MRMVLALVISASHVWQGQQLGAIKRAVHALHKNCSILLCDLRERSHELRSCDAVAPGLAFRIATMITGYASKELVGDSIWRGLPLAKATPSSRHYGGIFP